MYDYNCPDCNEAKLQSSKNARKINEIIDKVNIIIDNNNTTFEYLLNKVDEILGIINSSGVILEAPNGIQYKIKVNDDGTLTTEQI